VLPTGVGADAELVGAVVGPVLVGLGTGLVLVGVDAGPVLVGVDAGRVPVGTGIGPVPVGTGIGPVPVGTGIGPVPVGTGIGPVPVGTGIGPLLVGVPVGPLLVGVPVGPLLVGVPVGPLLVGVPVGPLLVGVPVGLLLVGAPVGPPPVPVVQLGTLMVSSSRVTAPFRASARPVTVSPVVTVIEVRARMVPWKTDPVPSVAELPTCQKTLQAWPPLMNLTELPEAVMSAEGTWKIQTAFGSFCASRISAPETPSPDEALYTPGARTWPAPMEAVARGVELCPAALLYAVVKSACAPFATPAPSSMYWVPVTVPGGNPVTEVPGYKPRSPPMVLGPVLVTVVPARTPKLAAVPRSGAVAVAASAGCVAMNRATAPAARAPAPRGDAASQA